MKKNRCLNCTASRRNNPCGVGKVAAAILLLAVWWGTMDPASASIRTRLTALAWDSEDIAARVQTDYGAGAAVADWNAIKDQFAGNLAAFYAQTGLADGGSALVTRGGIRFYGGFSQYYVKRSDGGWPDGAVHDSTGSLYLQSYMNIQMPVVATVPYQLGTARATTDDIPTLLQTEFGIGAVIAEWNSLKSEFASSPSAFYAQTGLADNTLAFVTMNGERFYHDLRQHFVQRSEGGVPSGYWPDSIGSLYLGAWRPLTAPPVVRVTLRLSPPMADSSDIPTLLESMYGAGMVFVDWNEITTQGVGKLGGFYAHTGLLNGQSAFVTRNGERAVVESGLSLHYYVTRWDSGSPPGSSLASLGTLFLQRWDNVTFPAVCKLVPPPVPTAVTASDNLYSDKVVVSWTGGAHTQSYNVWRSSSSTNNPAAAFILASGITGTSYQDNWGSGGYPYYYWVTACNGAGASAFSAGDAGTKLLVTSLNPTSRSIGNQAQQYQIAVTSNGLWHAADDQDWISLNLDTGNNNGTVIVTVTANTDSVVTRTGNITIGGQTHMLTQEGLVWPSPAAFRLTSAVADSSDIAALVTSTFGGSAAVADWNNLVAQAGPNLAAFYAQTGMGNQSVALVTKDGNRWTGGRHYFVKHSDTVPPAGEYVEASTGSLYLENWSPVVMPVLARMRYQITSAIPSTTDPLDWAQRSFGTRVTVAEWNTIKSVYAANPNAFYAHTGLRDRGMAWVKCEGSLTHPIFLTRYFVQRADNNSPNMPLISDVAGTLYLGMGDGSANPVIGDMAGWTSGGFATWMSYFSTVPVASRGASDDPDGDGCGNLAEYAAGTDPTDSTSRAGLYSPQHSGNSYTALFRRNTNATGVATYVQWSLDLNTWADSGDYIGPVRVNTKGKPVESGTGYSIIQTNASVVAGGPVQKLFLRCTAIPTS
jgi:hypothetical protein